MRSVQSTVGVSVFRGTASGDRDEAQGHGIRARQRSVGTRRWSSSNEFWTRINLSNAECFRIGNIGHLFETDIRSLLAAIQDALTTMGVELQRLPTT